jgi:hypothetical protein
VSASTAYATSPRLAAGVQGSGFRVQEELSSQAPKPSSPQALSNLPSGVHLGRTVLESLRRLPSQIAIIDDLLDGGLPRGRVSELIGPQSSGKTALLIAFLAAATRRSEVAAYVLERLLWVRPPSLKDAVRCTEIILQAGGFAAVVLDLSLNRGDAGASVISSPQTSPGGRGTGGHQRPATSRQQLPRFRLNVWPRLARAAEQSHAALIVLAPQRVTGSIAALGIETRVHKTLWRHGAWPLFDGFDVSVTVARSKLGPPGRSGRWLVVGELAGG